MVRKFFSKYCNTSYICFSEYVDGFPMIDHIFFSWKFILKIITYNLDFISPWKQSYNWRSGRLDPQMLITYSQLLIIYTCPLKWFLFSYCHCLLWWQHLGALLWIECVLGGCPGNLTILEGKGFSVEQQDETMVTWGSHEMRPVVKKEHGVTRGILVLPATTSWLMYDPLWQELI